MDKIGTKCFYEVSFLNLKKGSKLTELFQTICSPFFIKETVGFYLAFDVHYRHHYRNRSSERPL